jgi:hypothetical protein
MGTSNGNSFEEKIRNFSSACYEETAFSDRCGNANDKNDDKVDIILWKEFAYKQNIGKLFFLCQCATGDPSTEKSTSLVGSGFLQRWFMPPPIIPDPINVFAVSRIYDQHKIRYLTSNNILVMDRSRLMNYYNDSIGSAITDRAKRWVAGAMERVRTELTN